MSSPLLPAGVLHEIFEALECGLVVRDRTGEVVAANAAARRLMDPVGGAMWVDERRVPLDGGELELAVLRDTTREREAEDQLTQALAEMSTTYVELDIARDEIDRAARTDALTGAANRGHAAETLAAELAAGRPLGVLLLDVDHFKRVNDAYGHAAGDDVLVEVVRRTSKAVRHSDLVGRWGGEEFIVVTDAADADVLARLGERVRGAVAAGPVVAGEERIRVTVSVGAAAAGTPAPSADALVAAADAALYAAKDAGRDRVMLAG
jgi:diguanylate cyclase (GGDEF)-like protein